MADDRKRDEPVTFKVTERMFVDLNRVAALEDRTMSDLLFLMLRRHLYGAIVRADAASEQITTSDKVHHAEK